MKIFTVIGAIHVTLSIHLGGTYRLPRYTRLSLQKELRQQKSSKTHEDNEVLL